MKKLFVTALSFCLVLAGCNKQSDHANATDPGSIDLGKLASLKAGMTLSEVEQTVGAKAADCTVLETKVDFTRCKFIFERMHRFGWFDRSSGASLVKVSVNVFFNYGHLRNWAGTVEGDNKAAKAELRQAFAVGFGELDKNWNWTRESDKGHEKVALMQGLRGSPEGLELEYDFLPASRPATQEAAVTPRPVPTADADSTGNAVPSETSSPQPLPTWEEISHWSCRKYSDEVTKWGSKENRGNYAEKRTSKAAELVGYGQVQFSTLGDDGQWLYVEGHPETEDLLRQTANLTINSPGKTWADNRKAFCDFGFDTVTWKISYGSGWDSRSLLVARYTPTIRDEFPDIAKKVKEERRKAKVIPASN